MADNKKNRGRPSKRNGSMLNDDVKINNIEEVSETANEPELKTPLQKKTLSVPKHDDEITDDNENHLSDETDFDRKLEEELNAEFENVSGVNDIPEDDGNSLNEIVVERGYTDNLNTNTSNTTENTVERDIPEPLNQGGNKAMPDVDETLINPNANSNQNQNNNKSNDNDIPNNPSGNNTTSNNTASEPKKETQAQPKQEKSDNLKDLSPKEKRESIEKTADAILLAYQQYIPLPFVYFASYNEKKLDKLHDAGEIDLETQVRRDGTTFRQFVQTFNKDVEEKFAITNEEVESLREPLIDVLSEQDIAMTPLQRLMFIAGQHLVAKVFLCVKFLRDKKADMDTMREIHAEKMELLRQQNELIRKNRMKTNPPNTNPINNPINNPNFNSNPNPQAHTTSPKNDNITVTETVKDNSEEKESGISDAKVVETKKNKTETTPTLDEVLEGTDDENEKEEPIKKDNDIPA
jgi:hypothetical protein